MGGSLCKASPSDAANKGNDSPGKWQPPPSTVRKGRGMGTSTNDSVSVDEGHVQSHQQPPLLSRMEDQQQQNGRRSTSQPREASVSNKLEAATMRSPSDSSSSDAPPPHLAAFLKSDPLQSGGSQSLSLSGPSSPVGNKPTANSSGNFSWQSPMNSSRRSRTRSISEADPQLAFAVESVTSQPEAEVNANEMLQF